VNANIEFECFSEDVATMLLLVEILWRSKYYFYQPI